MYAKDTQFVNMTVSHLHKNVLYMSDRANSSMGFISIRIVLVLYYTFASEFHC